MIAASLAPGAEVRSPALSLARDMSERMASVPRFDALAELERVSLLRVGLQERLEAVFEERWSR